MFGSLLAILIVAVSAAPVEGVKPIVNVVDAPGWRLAAGAVTTLKSAASAPVKVIAPTLRTPVPLLLIVKVEVAVVVLMTLPRSVPSLVAGVASVSAMGRFLPDMPMAGTPTPVP